MAWTEKLPSGKYRGLYYLPSGARRSAGTFPHKKAARDAAIEAEAKVKRAGWRDPRAASITWGDWLAIWQPTRAIEPNTVGSEGSMIANYLLPHWRDVPLSDITRLRVQGWATGLISENVGTEEDPRHRAPASVRRYLNVFVSSLTAAVDAEVITVNPAVRIKLPPPPEGDQVFLTRAQYADLADAVPDARDRAVLDFLVGTGLRWSELAGLHLHRLDLPRGFVTVADTTDGAEVKPYPKGRRQRSVPILQWSVDNLEVPEPHACGLRHRGGGRCPSGLVFRARQGGPLDDRNFYRRVLSPALKRANLEHLGLTIHDLRHTYASWLAQDGVPLGRIAELLGHRSTTTTEIYAHFSTVTSDDIAFAMRDPRGANVGQTGAISHYPTLRRVADN